MGRGGAVRGGGMKEGGAMGVTEVKRGVGVGVEKGVVVPVKQEQAKAYSTI